MFKNHTRLSAGMVTLLIGLGAGGIAVNASQNENETQIVADPVGCEILATTDNSMTTLQGAFHSDEVIAGTYLFKVVKASHSGRSNIQQGGNFAAEGGDNVTLGRVMMGGSGATYEVSLSVTAGGKTYECSDRIGDIA
jgi:CsgH protein